MSEVFNLDSIREELENKYAPFKLQIDDETYVLQSLLRISKERRAKVIEAMKSMKSDEDPVDGEEKSDEVDLASDDYDEDEVLAAVKTILAAVVKGPEGRGQAMVDSLGSDLLLHMSLLEKWKEITQPGEAQDSPS
jgi:KaiC/GvpD/RAD55 family RecA-like ATPase